MLVMISPRYTVEPPLKETPNKGNLSIMNRITCPKTSLSYSANTFITSEERNLSIMNRITCPKSYVNLFRGSTVCPIIAYHFAKASHYIILQHYI